MKICDCIFITGGAGFIGSNFVLEWLCVENKPIINLDALTYSSNLNNLQSVMDNPNYSFVQGDIRDSALVEALLDKYRPFAVVNFAAESHVDRSIHYPETFINTNIIGTYRLLEKSLRYWSKLNSKDKENFRFLHVSTDEVYGSLGPEDPSFKEDNRYLPNNPYSASKAASDHFVNAYHHTYGLPVLTTNCSNNYGPYQFPEKLIPFMITNAMSWEPLLLYGDGLHVRDWLYVEDHCRAIRMVLDKGTVGETYNIGGKNEKTNLEVVNTICQLLDDLAPSDRGGYKQLITFIKDRPGHDRRYANDTRKIESELGWKPSEAFESGIIKTVEWYLKNQDWIKNIISGSYREWIKKNYQETGVTSK